MASHTVSISGYLLLADGPGTGGLSSLCFCRPRLARARLPQSPPASNVGLDMRTRHRRFVCPAWPVLLGSASRHPPRLRFPGAAGSYLPLATHWRLVGDHSLGKRAGYSLLPGWTFFLSFSVALGVFELGTREDPNKPLSLTET